MGVTEQRMEQLGITLQQTDWRGKGAVEAVLAGDMLYISAHYPVDENGTPVYVGRVGAEIDEATAYQAARLCGLNMLRTIQAYIGSLDRVDYFVKALGLVNSAEDFYNIDGAIKAASMSGKIVMVDSIPIVPERSYPDILARLRPGDVHTHVFAQQFPLMDENGRMQPYMLAERERGVHFDVGHGSGSFWFRQAVGCFNQGFWPDTISTDLHHQNVTGSAIDLLYVASKFLAMGMPLQDVLYRVTRAPALSIHRPELGTLDVGACADIAVLRNREGKFGYMDCGGARLTGEGKLECVATLREGEVVFDPEARSMPDWQNAPAPYWTAPGTTRSWTLWK